MSYANAQPAKSQAEPVTKSGPDVEYIISHLDINDNDRNRTCDLFRFKEALYLLSYVV